jgi:hypothetical protein
VEEQLGQDAHVVKTLGDALTVRIADPTQAAIAGLRIASRHELSRWAVHRRLIDE